MILSLINASCAAFIGLGLLALCSKRQQMYLQQQWRSQQGIRLLRGVASLLLCLCALPVLLQLGPSMGIALVLLLLAPLAILLITCLRFFPQHLKYWLFGALQIWWPSLFFLDWSWT